jgi:hypothetical protein
MLIFIWQCHIYLMQLFQWYDKARCQEFLQNVLDYLCPFFLINCMITPLTCLPDAHGHVIRTITWQGCNWEEVVCCGVLWCLVTPSRSTLLCHVMVYRDYVITHVCLAVLSACHAHAQHVAIWSAPMRPRSHYYLWYDSCIVCTICTLLSWELCTICIVLWLMYMAAHKRWHRAMSWRACTIWRRHESHEAQ